MSEHNDVRSSSPAPRNGAVTSALGFVIDCIVAEIDESRHVGVVRARSGRDGLLGSDRRLFLDEVIDSIDRQRSVKQEALNEIALERSESLELTGMFHSFGHGPQADAPFVAERTRRDAPSIKLRALIRGDHAASRRP